MVHAAEGGVDALGAVHLALVVLEARGDGVRGLDGVQPRLHVAHMGRAAADRDPGPDHADLGRIERGQAGPGLGDDHGIGLRHREHGGERAVAGAFLLDHRLHLHLGRGLHAGEAQRAEGRDVRDDARLHVPRAAPIHPPVADGRREGRRLPHVGRAFGHHVHMALQREAPALAFARRVHRDDVVAPFIGDQRRREARMRGSAAGSVGTRRGARPIAS
jgi:hypothetical protein